MALHWRFRPADAVFAGLFLAVGTCAWLHSRPVDLGVLLARETAGIGRAADLKAAIPLLPPPSSPEEARLQGQVFARWLAADRQAGWEALRAAVDRRGKPATQADGARAWDDYRAAAAAVRDLLDQWAAAREEADPALTARKTEDYLAAVNRLEAASDTLTAWALRLSAADFN